MRMKATFANRTDKPKLLAAVIKSMVKMHYFQLVKYPEGLSSNRLENESFAEYKKRRVYKWPVKI